MAIIERDSNKHSKIDHKPSIDLIYFHFNLNQTHAPIVQSITTTEQNMVKINLTPNSNNSQKWNKPNGKKVETDVLLCVLMRVSGGKREKERIESNENVVL